MADHASSEIDDLIELPLPVGSDIALEAISLIGGRSWPRPTRQPPALWLAEQGRGISASHANRQITRHTAAVFGPYGFRDAMA